ncbi:MAG: hydroxymethylglutaryl-CoA synthase [Pseudomonadales bacterium]
MVDGASSKEIGISGFAAYLPRFRVDLQDWCCWTGDSWDKVRAVIGRGFRMRGSNENAYTMAATAVLRLIRQYQIDPQQVGFLGLGTESSTDNSAGAVIVKGMVNDGLRRLGMAPLARACEVPEFKHACLGGVYALKAAGRYLAFDGADRVAIVVCADVAEYERATSGEPTQGAGAVAMLVERAPRMLALELELSGSASDYRGPDFRKPLNRFMRQTPTLFGQPKDFPVFNGKYSTTCYIDEVLAALRDMFARLRRHTAAGPARFLRDLSATFLHRPYQRMAETGLIVGYLLALTVGDADDAAELRMYAERSEIDVNELTLELTREPDVFALVEQHKLGEELYPLASRVARQFRSEPRFAELMTSLGVNSMQEVGNLYTASLPAWMAAGLEEAAAAGVALTGTRILTLGYGSGDAAEAIPMRVLPGWEAAAARIGFQQVLADPIALTRADYEALHAGAESTATIADDPGVFYIDRLGQRETHFDDSGIEYYRFTG